MVAEKQTPERIPFPENLVRYWDIVKGVGELVLHAAFDQIHHEPQLYESEHYRGPET